MTQRLASSKSPTKYASTASYRVKMACTWRCMSYLPTSRAISWTRCEKGSFQINRSVLFWNQWISWTATVLGWYFWGFFTFPAWRKSYQVALPSTVGWSFLLAGSSPPNIDGLASAATWANFWVSDDSSNLPTTPNLSVSSTLHSS